MPAGAGVQAPGVTLHDWQGRLQALAQHKLPAQNPDWHSPALLQPLPLASLPKQAPPLQYELATQSPSPLQLDGQAALPPLHR